MAPPPVGEPLGLSAVHGAAQTPPPSRPRGKSGAVGPGAEARRRGPAPGEATGWAGPDGAAGPRQGPQPFPDIHPTLPRSHFQQLRWRGFAAQPLLAQPLAQCPSSGRAGFLRSSRRHRDRFGRPSRQRGGEQGPSHHQSSRQRWGVT
jgi:hypothetical protein